jgi:hypothetical protein
VAAQPLNAIHWSTPVDLDPQYNGSDLYIHYGTPLITIHNTVIVTVKVGALGGFQLEGHNAGNGALEWVQPTDYILPPHGWTPVCGSTLTPQNVLYMPGAGGTLTYRRNPDGPVLLSPLPAPPLHSAPLPRSSLVSRALPLVSPALNGLPLVNTGQIAFYGIANYLANPQAFQNSVFINTPITSDASGNLYFGFYCTSSAPLGLQSGIARIAANGTGTWVSAASAANDTTITKVVQNCAPALSSDGTILYVAVNNGDGSANSSSPGDLLALNSQTLATLASVRLKDVLNGNDADLDDDGTASPTIGPDGDVYFGVLGNPISNNHYRGWLLHFDSLLTTARTPGAFGWDDTPSIVPASTVTGYTGMSSYLVLVKYNNYVEGGGDGVNRVAVLDPNAQETDPISGATVMQEVITATGPTPDKEHTFQYPNAVREWCINSAAIDPITKCALVNNEDGFLYHWDFTTNTLASKIELTSGIGEAYTPTLIGPDGTVYAISNATLFAIGK